MNLLLFYIYIFVKRTWKPSVQDVTLFTNASLASLVGHFRLDSQACHTRSIWVVTSTQKFRVNGPVNIHSNSLALSTVTREAHLPLFLTLTRNRAAKAKDNRAIGERVEGTIELIQGFESSEAGNRVGMDIIVTGMYKPQIRV